MKCPIHHKELVCPTCLAMARGRKSSKAKAAAARRNGLQTGAAQREPAMVYGLYDCLAAFQAHPQKSFSRQELIATASASKHVNAEKVMRNRLQILLAKKMILRVGRGLYQLAM